MRKVMAAVLAVLLASPATAHVVDPSIVTRIDSITPPLPGVTVEIRAGVADQLLVVNHTKDPVEVLDETGRPFLRIGPDDVEADLGTTAWYASNSPNAAAVRTPERTTPRWRVVARGNTWGWFDHRMHDRDLVPPPDNVPTRLADWTVPLRQAGRDHAVRGHVAYEPPTGRFATRLGAVPQGVSVDLFDGRVPGIFLRWGGPGTLTVYGIDGEPFARLARDRTEVNAASATWRDDQSLRGTVTDAVVDAGGVRWVPVPTPGMLTWLDRRLAYAPGIPPDDARRARTPTTVVEWDIRLDLDGRTDHLQGTTEWVPNPRPDTDVPWWPPVLVGVVFGALLAVLLRVRFRARSER